MADKLSAAAMPTVIVYAAGITAPNERGKAMGAIGAATGLGFIFCENVPP